MDVIYLSDMRLSPGPDAPEGSPGRDILLFMPEYRIKAI